MNKELFEDLKHRTAFDCGEETGDFVQLIQRFLRKFPAVIYTVKLCTSNTNFAARFLAVLNVSLTKFRSFTGCLIPERRGLGKS